ncbi:unnamed protein product [Acanthoscelides obtectus]|uniref:Uncharacterized protein n=1 Tax=Acanthoscelides obtectus TaxID=200917 RepID=A0A9P0PM43_ACAOB|nr:unnamed protein product [Acanthoscelides obtectus]CAK1684006.1 15-hydroxyprostaglandin dehydrogenase [NAD(+)] [Acanthoscelides obtectus]
MTTISGKVALVTGGANGIGLAIVNSLLENDVKGVAMVDITKSEGFESLQHKYGSKVIFLNADVTKGTQLEDAFEKTVQTFKNLDLVFNNAGIADEDRKEEMIALNLMAVVRGTCLALEKYFPKHKSSSEEPVIVNTASIFGLDTWPIYPVYCASKHGVIGFGKALSMPEAYTNHKTKIISICPTLIKTNLTTLFMVQNPDMPYLTPDEVGKRVMDILKKTQGCATWVIDVNKTYEVEFPPKESLEKE